MPVVINGDTGITQSGEFNSDSTMGFKNRVINGEMDIDQRNNGAALALTNNSGYPVDRFIAVAAATTTITFQQSSVAPAGFTRSLSATMTTPKSLAAADLNRIIHRFEGFNIADLGWDCKRPARYLIFLGALQRDGNLYGAIRQRAVLSRLLYDQCCKHMGVQNNHCCRLNKWNLAY